MFRKIVTIAIFISIFIWSYILSREPAEIYIGYVVFLALFPFFFARYGVPKWPVILFIPILLSGIVYCLAGMNTYTQFFKVFIGFFASTLFFHYVLELFNFDIKKLFGYYMKGCVLISAIGIFQVISYQVGFTPGYNYLWIFNKWNISEGGIGIRLNSVFSEPAYFAATVAPAFFVSIFNIPTRDTLFITKRQSFLIAIAYLLTSSSVGILGAFLVILLMLINLGFVRYAIFFIPLFIISFKYSYENVAEFRDRYDGTVEIFSTANYKSYDIHGSSFVLYNNYHVALENFKRNPLFGTGLGSHPTAFDKYSLTNLAGAVDIDFNRMDANSMFLRLMSETGIYGLAIFILLLYRCWIFKSTAKSREHWVMSNALACIILLYLLRQGHYFYNGFPFFVWMFYYLARDNWNGIGPEDGKVIEEQETPGSVPATA